MVLANKAEETESQCQLQPSSNGSTSFFRSCINAINTLSGIGILSVPYALSEGGWVSIIVLLIVAMLFSYTGVLLRRCMDTDTSIKTYPDLGYRVFGYKGRVLVSMFVYLELYLMVVEFMILEGDHLDKLFPNMHFKFAGLNFAGKQGFILLSALVILPTTWLKSLNVMAYISGGGVLASVILIICVFWAGIIDGVGFHEKVVFVNWRGLPTTTSMFAFCYCGHAVLPTIRSSMKDRNQFSKLVLVSFIISTLTFGSVAVPGYLMYGDHLKSQVTLNLPDRKFSTKLAVWTTLVNPLAKYAVAIKPIVIGIEDAFSFHDNRYRSILINTAIVISTTIVAITIPYFGYVMAFIGSFLSIAVSVLFPCLFYLRINKGAVNFGIECAILVGIIVVGFVVAVIGTYTSVIQIANNL